MLTPPPARARARDLRPDYYLDMNYIGGKRRMKKANMEVRKAVIPDDIRLLQRLVQEKRLMLTPAQDYDDSYTIEFVDLLCCIGEYLCM